MLAERQVPLAASARPPDLASPCWSVSTISEPHRLACRRQVRRRPVSRDGLRTACRRRDRPLLARLHDPTRHSADADVGSPRRWPWSSLAVINAEVDSLIGPGVLLLDLGAVPELSASAAAALGRRSGPPSRSLGLPGIAQQALHVLRASGWRAPAEVSLPSAWRQPGRFSEPAWLARHGAATFLLRLSDQAGRTDRPEKCLGWPRHYLSGNRHGAPELVVLVHDDNNRSESPVRPAI